MRSCGIKVLIWNYAIREKKKLCLPLKSKVSLGKTGYIQIGFLV